jgi:hypothetical protein
MAGFDRSLSLFTFSRFWHITGNVAFNWEIEEFGRIPAFGGESSNLTSQPFLKELFR